MAVNDTYPYNDIEQVDATKSVTVTRWNEQVVNPLNAVKDELGTGPKGTAVDLTTRLAVEHNDDGTHSGAAALADTDIPTLGDYLKVDGSDAMEGDLDLSSYALTGMSYKARIGWNALEGGSWQTRIGTKENPPLVPSLTTTERNALSPSNGLMIYNETTNEFQKYQNGAWESAWPVSGTPNSYEAAIYGGGAWATDMYYQVRTLVVGVANAATGTQAWRVVLDTMGPTATIVRARAYADTAPSGGTVLIDINVGSRGVTGTSIWSATQANRLTIADGGKDSGVQASFDNVSIGDGQEITFDIDQLSSADNITIQLTVKVPLVV